MFARLENGMKTTQTLSAALLLSSAGMTYLSKNSQRLCDTHFSRRLLASSSNRYKVNDRVVFYPDNAQMGSNGVRSHYEGIITGAPFPNFYYIQSKHLNGPDNGVPENDIISKALECGTHVTWYEGINTRKGYITNKPSRPQKGALIYEVNTGGSNRQDKEYLSLRIVPKRGRHSHAHRAHRRTSDRDHMITPGGYDIRKLKQIAPHPETHPTPTPGYVKPGFVEYNPAEDFTRRPVRKMAPPPTPGYEKPGFVKYNPAEDYTRRPVRKMPPTKRDYGYAQAYVPSPTPGGSVHPQPSKGNRKMYPFDSQNAPPSHAPARPVAPSKETRMPPADTNYYGVPPPLPDMDVEEEHEFLWEEDFNWNNDGAIASFIAISKHWGVPAPIKEIRHKANSCYHDDIEGISDLLKIRQLRLEGMVEDYTEKEKLHNRLQDHAGRGTDPKECAFLIYDTSFHAYIRLSNDKWIKVDPRMATGTYESAKSEPMSLKKMLVRFFDPITSEIYPITELNPF